MKKYPMIDVFRVICACLVVILHCLEIKKGHPYSHMVVFAFSQQAVPFFFIVSGFFFAKKMYAISDKKSFMIQYVKKNLGLYLVWVALFIPEIIITYNGIYPEASMIYKTAVILRRIVFAGQGVYWYLLALAEATLLAGILIIYRKEKIMYVLAMIGILLGFVYCLDLYMIRVRRILYLEDLMK